MAELIHEYATLVRTRDGDAFVPRTYAEQQPDGLWTAWIEFAPVGSHAPTLRTDRETTQSNRQAIVYWASGLEPLYFEGAFERARLMDVAR